MVSEAEILAVILAANEAEELRGDLATYCDVVSRSGQKFTTSTAA